MWPLRTTCDMIVPDGIPPRTRETGGSAVLDAAARRVLDAPLGRLAAGGGRG
jgi:hypothetical protein